jgi:hypothetical protein
MVCYGFPYLSPACSGKVAPTQAPLAPCGSEAKHRALPHVIEKDTLPIAYLISRQVVPYWTHGGTGCLGGGGALLLGIGHY